MKNQVSGTLNVPASGMTEQVNDLQSRYYRSLAPDCELRTTSDKWYFAAILKKLSLKVCGFKKNSHLCSDFHIEQASRLAIFAAGIFYVRNIRYSSVPCGALMRPLPVQGGSQRGAELFCFLPVVTNILFHFKRLPK